MFTQSIINTINSRYSCRAYDGKPLSAANLGELNAAIGLLPPGPFGTTATFGIIAATPEDSGMLKGLGTYGFIKGFSAFIVGMSGNTKEELVDFGYQMEYLVLKATELSLGSCWLGGSFTRSSFAKAMKMAGSEKSIPCVISLGNMLPGTDMENDKIRNMVGGGQRKELEKLVFHGNLDTPMAALQKTIPPELLEAFRRAPSASNKQPWRLVVASDSNAVSSTTHLYLNRTPGYGTGFMMKFAGIQDIQMIDMGIALAHIALAAEELKFGWAFKKCDPELTLPDALTEYIVNIDLDAGQKAIA